MTTIVTKNDVFSGYGVRIALPSNDHFLMVAETLERMGVANHKTKTLYQSCHILHKRSEFAILHFKELFILDNRWSDFSKEDRFRRNRIANLLQEWGLATILDKDLEVPEKSPAIKILGYSEAMNDSWTLQPKYRIGNKKSRRGDN